MEGIASINPSWPYKLGPKQNIWGLEGIASINLSWPYRF
jgi:hypothetical protein